MKFVSVLLTCCLATGGRDRTDHPGSIMPQHALQSHLATVCWLWISEHNALQPQLSWGKKKQNKKSWNAECSVRNHPTTTAKFGCQIKTFNPKPSILVTCDTKGLTTDDPDLIRSDSRLFWWFHRLQQRNILSSPWCLNGLISSRQLYLQHSAMTRCKAYFTEYNEISIRAKIDCSDKYSETAGLLSHSSSYIKTFET